MPNQQLLIHVGYPKSASTWLQEVIFNDENAGFFAPWDVPSSEAIQQFAIPNAFRFSGESVFRVFEPGLQEATRRNLIPVLSHEHLVGNQIRGRYWGKEVADRIHAVFPEARILILIREQKSMILSSYRQYIKGGGTATIERFVGATLKRTGFEPILRLDSLEYDLLIAYYQNLFGKNQILVVPFELFKKKQQDVCNDILDFAGSDKKINLSQMAKNVGFRGGTLAVQRQLNCFCEPPDWGSSFIPLRWKGIEKLSRVVERLAPSGIHASIENRWQQFITEYLGDRFRKSNQRTSRLIGLNLADFGYDC